MTIIRSMGRPADINVKIKTMITTRADSTIIKMLSIENEDDKS